MWKSVSWPAMALVFCLLLAGCSSGGAGNGDTTIKDKNQISSLIKEKDYEKVQKFIQRNKGLESKTDLVQTAISSLFKTKDQRNTAFLEELFNQMLGDGRVADAARLIGGLETSQNTETIENFKEEADSFKKNEKTVEELKDKEAGLKKEKVRLMEQYPYDIPLDDTNLHYFGGVILQKINDWEYRVIQRDASAKEYVLKTVKTSFSSTGKFDLYVIAGEIESYKMQNGFSEKYQVLYEIPEENLNQIKEINEVWFQIDEASKEIEEREKMIEGSRGNLQSALNDIFNLQKGPEIKKGSETTGQGGIFEEKDNKFYINGITLDDTREHVIAELGEPISEEEDESGYSAIIMKYERMDVHLLKGGTVASIELDTDRAAFNTEFLNAYSGVKYANEAGDIFLFNSESEHMVFTSGDGESFKVYLEFGSYNFKNELELGKIKPIEE